MILMSIVFQQLLLLEFLEIDSHYLHLIEIYKKLINQIHYRSEYVSQILHHYHQQNIASISRISNKIDNTINKYGLTLKPKINKQLQMTHNK